MEQETPTTITDSPRKSPFGVALKYAIITALAAFIFSLIMYVTRLYLNQSVSWLYYVILLAGLIFAVKDRRDKELGGYITFGEAFGTGFLMCMIYGVFSIITTMVMMNLIAPEMLTEILKQTEQSMIDKGMSDEQIQLGMTYTKKFMTPGWMSLWLIVMVAIFGCILSLIVAAIFKKNNPMLQPPM